MPPRYRAGQQVPASGIYQCDCAEGGHQWSTDVAGPTFPPLPCSGSTWRLRTKTHQQ
ncbi:hypothetical protein [Streptomyces sp. NBC_01187]|uniref:hypothetical protein n=1 Tax=Streptomyces sp. NBC_01187 TaxID=2903766 RepID=UPI00386E9FB1|nr:hypothetical protein OG220_00125 [Streptomyces sp. NBC_01187]